MRALPTFTFPTKQIIILIISILSNSVYGQGYFNNWYFGSGAGLDFNSGTPISINGNINTIEGCASMSDYSGNLLFYTDGSTVWDANHAIMGNGTGLLGHASSTQSALIVPNPGNENQYYIFTTPVNGSGSFTYSIVDMTLANGLGAVSSTKNIVLHSTSTERVTAVGLPNEAGFWIIGHETTNNVFFAYKLAASGLSSTPVLSSIGSVHSTYNNYSNFIGYLKPSHSGDKLTIAIKALNLFEVFDFDNSSGIISNVITFPSYPGPYGVEFSSDDSRLYVSGGGGGSNPYIYQVNMNAGNNTDIINSSTLIATPVNYGGVGALQIGPDSKIYVAKHGTTSLGVINTPNALGTFCNYVDDQILLTSATSRFGLPNNYSIGCSSPILNLGNDTTLCQGQTLTLNAGSATSYLWSDGSTASSIIASTPGIFWVQSSNGQCLATDSITISVNQYPVPELGNDTTICQGQILPLNGGSATSYIWSNGSTASSIIASTPGTYWVQSNNGQCLATDSINIDLTIIQAEATLLDHETLEVQSIPSATYQWVNCENGYAAIPNAISQVFNPQENGSYAVVITTENSCSDTSACIIVSELLVSSNVNMGALVVAPNPTYGQFTIHNQNGTITGWELISISGQYIASKEIKGESSTEVYISGKSGLYFVIVSCQDGTRYCLPIIKH